MEILGVYNITYVQSNVTQVKNLVSHARWKELKDALEEDLKKPEKERTIPKDIFKKTFGENYFTDQSPLGLAMTTGIMILPKHQGGEHEVKFEQIK